MVLISSTGILLDVLSWVKWGGFLFALSFILFPFCSKKYVGLTSIESKLQLASVLGFQSYEQDVVGLVLEEALEDGAAVVGEEDDEQEYGVGEIGFDLSLVRSRLMFRQCLKWLKPFQARSSCAGGIRQTQ